jgi:hypothetical protein
MELFRAFTVRENYKNRDVVIVDWFADGRRSPVAPLEEMVANLAQLSEAERAWAKERLDRLLTAREADALTQYIRTTTGFEVKRGKIELPLADGGKAPDFSGKSTPGRGDYFPIHEAEGYTLSIPITGFADLSEPPNTVSAA